MFYNKKFILIFIMAFFFSGCHLSFADHVLINAATEALFWIYKEGEKAENKSDIDNASPSSYSESSRLINDQNSETNQSLQHKDKSNNDQMDARLIQLKSIYDNGLITEQEYKAKEMEIISDADD